MQQVFIGQADDVDFFAMVKAIYWNFVAMMGLSWSARPVWRIVADAGIPAGGERHEHLPG